MPTHSDPMRKGWLFSVALFASAAILVPTTGCSDPAEEEAAAEQEVAVEREPATEQVAVAEQVAAAEEVATAEQQVVAEREPATEQVAGAEEAAAGKGEEVFVPRQRLYTVVDGAVDKATFNGYRRYHSECHVCHGPDGLGSSFGPSLVESLKVLSIEDFFEVTMNGQVRTAGTTKYVMPAFGTNPNVANHLEDIFRYLKARSDGVLPRGRPPKIGQKRRD